MKHALFVSACLFVVAPFAVEACSERASDAPTVAGPTGPAVPGDPVPDPVVPDSSVPGTPTFRVVASFDPKAFELPESVVVHDGAAYVALAPLGQIVRVRPDGSKHIYARIPPGYTDGSALGLVFDQKDNLYVLAAKNAADAGVVPGVYKIPPSMDGGMVAAPFAVDPSMTFPNAIAIDTSGNLFITDSAVGRIFKVTPEGTVTTWANHPELGGTPACDVPLPFPIGANGIALTPSAIFVANTAKGSIVKIAVNADGTAGAASTIVRDCQYVGVDGLSLDTDGSLLVAQNGPVGRLLRVSQSGTVDVLHVGDPLDSPASVEVTRTFGKDRVALVTSAAFFSIGVDGGTPKPALLEYGPLP
jgi:sugar lactone lactonase YvrE